MNDRPADCPDIPAYNVLIDHQWDADHVAVHLSPENGLDAVVRVRTVRDALTLSLAFLDAARTLNVEQLKPRDQRVCPADHVGGSGNVCTELRCSNYGKVVARAD